MVTNESQATLYICMHGCKFSIGAHRCAIEAPSEPIMGPKIASAVVTCGTGLGRASLGACLCHMYHGRRDFRPHNRLAWCFNSTPVGTYRKPAAMHANA